MLRTLGKGPGYLVFACDALKGIAAVLLAYRFFPALGDLGAITSAVGCILGHNFTPWLAFKGGKGIATSLGVLIALLPLASVIVLGLWILIFLATRFVSLASILAAGALPVVVWFLSGRGTLFGLALDRPARHRAPSPEYRPAPQRHGKPFYANKENTA